MNIAPITLSGQRVELRPLSLEDVPALCDVGLDDDLWRWIPTPVRTRDDMEHYVRIALGEQAGGRSLPFVITALPDRVVVGSTRYANIDRPNQRLEIGWTWVSGRWQRTAVNTEAKLLLLTHAFEVLGCERVEFKTDRLNARSRAALLRIGAVEEGVFRRVAGRARGVAWETRSLSRCRSPTSPVAGRPWRREIVTDDRGPQVAGSSRASGSQVAVNQGHRFCDGSFGEFDKSASEERAWVRVGGAAAIDATSSVALAAIGGRTWSK